MDNKSNSIEIIHRSTEGLDPFEILQNTEDDDEQDFQRLKESFRHNIFKPVVKPPAIYSFAGEIVGTSGNLSLIIGKAKFDFPGIFGRTDFFQAELFAFKIRPAKQHGRNKTGQGFNFNRFNRQVRTFSS